jgi:hypothetical protein
MLFPRNALPSGPQACFFSEKNKSEGEQTISPLPTPALFEFDRWVQPNYN